MLSLRPHKQFNFVGMWKYGFILSGFFIALAIAGFVTSTITTGFPLTLGTEFSGGTSIQISDAGDVDQDQISEAFSSAASDLSIDSQISSIQVSESNGQTGYIIKTTDTVSTDISAIMTQVEESLSIDESNVQIETIGASWGSSVVWSSIVAFLLSCLAILLVITFRYREPRMGVVALITLFHDMIIVLGIYAWAGMFIDMEITSDVIAALLAIVGYSLYDTIVIFHRINKNASPQMKCSLKTCANRSVNEVIVRSLNTSITSIIPVFFMLILGTDTLLDFAFAMFIGMIFGVYSTLAISSPIYTLWKCREPDYARLEKKYPYEVVQYSFTKKMMKAARKDSRKAQAQARKENKALRKKNKAARKQDRREGKKAKKAAKKEAKHTKKAAKKDAKHVKKAAKKEAKKTPGSVEQKERKGTSASEQINTQTSKTPEQQAKREAEHKGEHKDANNTNTQEKSDNENKETEKSK